MLSVRSSLISRNSPLLILPTSLEGRGVKDGDSSSGCVVELVCGRLVTGEKGDNRAVEGVADGMAVISGTSDILAGDGVTPKPEGTSSGKEKGEGCK